MINIIQSIDKIAKLRKNITQPKEICSLAKYLRTNYTEFTVSEPFDFTNLPVLPGLYLFEARFNFVQISSLENFGDAWGKIRGEKFSNCIPRYYPNRAKHHFERIKRQRFIPFYLGKEKNIRKRISNHFESDLESGTYSLKLKSRLDLINDVSFRLGYCSFNIDLQEYYCIELIEKELRKILNPIIGKQ